MSRLPGISFGIVTSGNSDESLSDLVASIRNQSLPLYEIIIVGNTEVNGEDIINLPFDEHLNKGWITRKKNLIAQRSNFETLVILHDYFLLDPNWHKGISRFSESNDLNVAACRVITKEGNRYHDYQVWIHNAWWLTSLLKKSRGALLPYWAKGLSRYIYVSGGLILCKKQFLLQNPLDESLFWGEAEDVEWSLRIRNNWKFAFIKDSVVIANKDKELSYKPLNFVELLLIYSYKLYDDIKNLFLKVLQS